MGRGRAATAKCTSGEKHVAEPWLQMQGRAQKNARTVACPIMLGGPSSSSSSSSPGKCGIFNFGVGTSNAMEASALPSPGWLGIVPWWVLRVTVVLYPG